LISIIECAEDTKDALGRSTKMDVKLVLADPKTGKCYQKELKEADMLQGNKIGSKIKGDSIGLPGYEFEMTGGSDNCGFPMRKDVEGTERKKILAVDGVGLKTKRRGQKQRKTVRGNTIGQSTTQINLKIIKYGKEKLGLVEEEKKEDSSEKPVGEVPKKEDNKSEKDSKSEEKKEVMETPPKSSEKKSEEKTKETK
jgi:small subunit ribosomal protein S6e